MPEGERVDHDGNIIIAELVGFCQDGTPVWCEVEPVDTRVAAEVLHLDWTLTPTEARPD